MHKTDGRPDLLLEAAALESADPQAAARLYAQAFAADPASIVAHNGLERLGAPERYSRWMHVNCIIDPRDDIYRFFAGHAIAANPIREYLADGWRTLSELMRLLEGLDRPLLKMQDVLEFAAGFGRFTRHLCKALPGAVTCTDIQAGSMAFVREQFGVKAFDSAVAPADLAFPEQYDLIFVLSMFTHLPPATWSDWIAHLHRGLKPGGLLVFSVHNEDYAREEGVAFDAAGTCFLPSSESPQLGADTYGTTFTTPAFVADAVRRALGREPLLHARRVFWVGQDAVVVRA